jgi:hypothetical protein
LFNLRELHKLLSELVGIERIEGILIPQLRREKLQEHGEIAGDLGFVERIGNRTCAGSRRYWVDGRHAVLRREYQGRRPHRQDDCSSAGSGPAAFRPAPQAERRRNSCWLVVGSAIDRAGRIAAHYRWS